MNSFDHLCPLTDYCRKYEWPRITQWHNWIYSKHPIAIQCIKKIGGRYMVDLTRFTDYINNSKLEEKDSENSDTES